ncbi:hypothetical protein [Actinopolymorpha pittospori]|uniref:Uncharacterized protein n=1 Tax=Actinopolymorpha pittospori TaxID=648752 RepID=A0A927MPD0_9ACTN|nr:hypothetical protein [Actinopolymorpha pittospori]MBE1604224.1 hypothetical protein [Actinopolymorpha pittospori]
MSLTDLPAHVKRVAEAQQHGEPENATAATRPDQPLGQDDVPALLRRVANSIEEHGQVWVQDLVLHNEVTADEDWYSVTVYFREESE